MAALPELHPVVQAPWFEGSRTWPWPITDLMPYSFIRLSGELPEQEIGLVLAQLVKYNHLEAEPTVSGLLAAVMAAERLLLPGGVQASIGSTAINPSCCCGLEGWREWLACQMSGESPWLGHDPSPRIEWTREAVRVWSDGGLGPAPDAFAVRFERTRFVEELGRVERELQAFLLRAGEWAVAVGCPHSSELCRKLDSSFGITGPVATEKDANSGSS